MDRREVVRYISLLLGGTLVGAGHFLSGCTNADNRAMLSANDIAYLDEIAETILPATHTPGAKAAHVGAFITIMVNECYDEKEQKVFLDGLDKINELSNKHFKNPFINTTSTQRHELLSQLDKEQKEYMQNKKPDETPHYFRMMKELTLLGYFTSEIGCTQAKRYVPVPGRFEGCIPYKKGDRAFA